MWDLPLSDLPGAAPRRLQIGGRLRRNSDHLNDTLIDYLVIGAGPGGLQLGYFLERAGHNYLIVEASDAPAEFFRTFPRHRRLISINKPHTGSDDPEFNLRMDWNSLLTRTIRDPLFTSYSEPLLSPAADDLVRYLADFAPALSPCGSSYETTRDPGAPSPGRPRFVVTDAARPDVAGPHDWSWQPA